MWRLAGALVLGACLAAPGVASAYDNDLELYKLGSPTALPEVDADPFAQERFARFASDFALALTPMPADLVATGGDAGFSIGFTPQVAFVHSKQTFSDGLEREVWPTSGEAPSALFLPTLHLRKGLPFSLEVGTDFTYVTFSTMVVVGGSLKWAIVEGFQWFPDIAVRAFGATVLGTGAMNVVTGGWDVGMSYRFPINGSVEAALSGGYQRMGMNATTGNIDFNPSNESATEPTKDDNVFEELPFGPVFKPTTGFHRVYVGAQVRYGVLVLGVDGISSWGTNSISAGSQTTFDSSMFKVAARIGVWF